jgi:hypothetical protein
VIKFRPIALATACTLSLSLFLPIATEADESNQPCQAYLASLDTSNGTDDEINNCPIIKGMFSIRGTFSNSNWRASFSAWEPAYYILYVKNQKDGKTINLTGFDVIGTTSRPQYRFIDEAQNITYVVTFRYSDSNAIRLEIYQNNRAIVNELLARESDKVMGGP